jgi:NADPH:quinone reductase-like Zn-dependent oxidoreductase
VKALVRNVYGSPDVLEVEDVTRPEPTDDEVLVRVRAASVNPADWYNVTAPLVVRIPNGIRKPKTNRLGVDFAGTVDAVGANVTQFQPGDDVFGARNGAFAEYVCVNADRAVVPKPENVSFEEAAAVPIAAITALQGLRDKGQLQPGQKVVVNGASGGVGTFGVQIAKALGADVTAVCSTRNVEQAHSLGADRVVDYTREDFTRSGDPCDLLLDIAGSRSWWELKRVIDPHGTLVIVGAQKKTGMFGPLGHILGLRFAAIPGSRKATFFIAKLNKPDMETLQQLLASGQMKSVIERRYELHEAADAFRYLGEGHARGKLVIAL